MPITATFQRTFQCAGLSFNTTRQVSADVAAPFSVALAAAKVGQLTTRTDNNTGVLTMAGGHGILNGDRLDVYWTGGSRRGMSVTGVSTNLVTIDLGAGDNLPTNLTNVTAMVPDVETLAVPG